LNDHRSAFCAQCGYKFDKLLDKQFHPMPKEKPTSDRAKLASSQMHEQKEQYVVCVYCGGRIAFRDNNCRHCGAPTLLVGSFSLPPEPPPFVAEDIPAPQPPPLANKVNDLSAGQRPAAALTPADVYVPNHLVWAILTTLFCCLPVGMFAIVYSLQVNDKLALGDVEGAREASEAVKTACWGAVGSYFFFLICVLVTTIGEQLL